MGFKFAPCLIISSIAMTPLPEKDKCKINILNMMKGYIKILRPMNCLMAAFAVVIGANMGGALALPVFFAALASFLICGAGNAINDYYDFEIDKINNPSRPLPSGMLRLKTAHKYSIYLFATGVTLSFFINFSALLLAVFNSITLYLYGASIKNQGGLIKNLTVSYLVASPFLFGGIAVDNPSVTLFLVFVALMVNTSREIVKDIEDYEGDVEHLETLPVRYGFMLAAFIAIFFIAASILLSLIPYTRQMVNIFYVPFILITDAILIYSMAVLVLSPKEKAGAVQRLIKLAMVLALLGFYIGSF